MDCRRLAQIAAISPIAAARFALHWKVPLVLVVALAGGSAHAGNYGYNVTYNSKIERGEMELMLMNDITQPSSARREEGFGTYLSHMVELEYGLTNQLATEFMIEWFEDLDTSDRRFTGFRWESRYRLFNRPVPFNPMVYAEYEDLDPATRFKMEVSGWINPPYEEAAEEEPDRERILETRLVLSQDLGPVNAALNWINESDVTNGHTAFGYSAGVMWMLGHHAGHAIDGAAGYSCPMHREVKQSGAGACPKCGMALAESRSGGGCTCKADMPGCGCGHCSGGGGECPCGHKGGVGVGLEAYGALGDVKSFGLVPARQEHYLGPILMYHITNRLMMHTQLAIGLTRASDNLVRLNFGYDF